MMDKNSVHRSRRKTCSDARRRRLGTLREAGGAQLLEFALALPLLLVLLTGVLDFATAYNTKQKLNNAAREGARLGVAQGMTDLTQATPASVQVIRDAVVSYLTNANLDTSFIGSAMAPAGGFTWTYYSSGTYGLKIERDVLIPATGGGFIACTRVTLNYPYNWTFGFNKTINMLAPSSYPATTPIASDATMPY